MDLIFFTFDFRQIGHRPNPLIVLTLRRIGRAVKWRIISFFPPLKIRHQIPSHFNGFSSDLNLDENWTIFTPEFKSSKHLKNTPAWRGLLHHIYIAFFSCSWAYLSIRRNSLWIWKHPKKQKRESSAESNIDVSTPTPQPLMQNWIPSGHNSSFSAMSDLDWSL